MHYARAILDATQDAEAHLADQRERIGELKRRLEGHKDGKARNLLAIANALIHKSIWIVGGDGVGLRHQFALKQASCTCGRCRRGGPDTQVCSNTGGPASKATPRGAMAKFAAAASRSGARISGCSRRIRNIYIAQIALGADNAQTVKALAKPRPGPGHR